MEIFVVGLGAFLGGVARYLIGGWVHRLLDNPWFPYGTLVVNTAGCVLIGVLSGLAETRSVFGAETRLFLFLGVLGGFTTFSSFAYETFALARDAQVAAASINIALQLFLGLAGVWTGNILARLT